MDAAFFPAASIEPATLAADNAILTAFAARCREFAENYDRELMPDEEDSYLRRLDMHEAVVNDTPATTVAGVVAKLRVAFHRQYDDGWVDYALIGPAHTAFGTGLAAAEPGARYAWAAIENLARIGGVDLGAQSLGVAQTEETAA